MLPGNTLLTGSYDYRLVALSVVIAIFASYAALDLAGRVTAAKGRARVLWLIGGATAMGHGIWSMHFIGMLAFSLPTPMHYDWPTVLASLLAAILASAVALYVVSRQRMGLLRAFAGSLVMGAGIAAMHYIGMAAMRLAAMCRFDPFLVGLSVALAVVISFVAMWLAFLAREERKSSALQKIASAAVMGAAIPVMHYTGMAAASFMASSSPPDLSRAIGTSALGTAAITTGTVMALAAVVLTSVFHRRYSAQTTELESVEQRYRLLFERNPQPMWVCDVQSLAFLEVNKAALEQYGFSRDEFLHMTIRDIRPAEHVPVLLPNVSHEVAEFAKSRTSKHRRKSGALIDVDITSHDFDWAGRPAKLVLATDITERRRAEEKLSQLASIVESSDDAIIGKTLDGLIISWNRGAQGIYGYSASEVLGQPVSILLPPNSPDDICEILEKLKRGESVQQYETTRMRKDGQLITVSLTISPVHTADGKITGASTIARNISERIKAEEKFHKAFIACPEPITIATVAEGRFLDVNESFLRATGHQREEVIGRTSIELNFWERTEDRDQLLEGLRKKGSIRDLEIAFRTKSGEHRTGLNSAEIIDVGGHECVLAIMKDVTEQKLLEKQLRQSQKMEAVGQLSSGIAHDFNNLLGVIIGYSEVLEKRLPQREALRQHCEEIKKAGHKAASLTRQLLAFSRQQVLEPKVLDLNAIVLDVDTMLRRLIGEDIDLRAALDMTSGHTKADKGQMEQVIINLAVNARDAMPQGGTLTIETANVEVDEEFARQHHPQLPGPYLLLTVSDTGTGMDAETQARIFEPFFTTKEVGKGTGLGLSTVYGIVRQSGGHIWVYSKLGHGTTFRIYLPRVEEAARVQNPTAGQPTSMRGSETILLVEDEEALRKLTRHFLVESGYTVLATNHPDKAVQIARHHGGPIHLLLTDVVMPGMNGYSLAENLATMRPAMRVVYMSGYTNFKQGALFPSKAFVLSKPFTEEALLRCVHEVLAFEAEPEAVTQPSM